MVLFDREGRLVVAEAKGPNNEVKPESNLETGDVFLSDDLMKEITDKGQTVVHELRAKKGLEIIVYTRVVQKGNKTAGFLEETLELSTAFVQGIKKRLNLEAVIFNDKDMPVASSRDDFFLYPKDYFPGKLGDGTRTFFEFTSREEAFGMLASRLVDSQGHPFMTLGLAASKKDSQVVLHRITNTLLTVTALILLFLIPTLIYVSNRVVEPINLLVEATQRMEKGETASKLPIKSDTEIGILVDSFNKMAENIKTSQSSLIHSAKMASLGQLVAGVAHELNNPIGFIYSNMVHLRDYVNKLLKVLDVAENKPQDLAKIKEEVEYSYVVEDLNKLIASCEDGARRTRDIVLGLRNFSRLDEAQLKRVDLHEGIRNTLRLLAGELKNRIKVHEDYGKLPEVRCYVSQLNQVFMNIVSNAAQAIPGEGEIWIKTWREGEWACISIKDTGPGISQDDIDKIFDPFFTTKPVGRGTGLGLSISYGIVQKHGGEIIVKSKKGQGTEFVVRVPVDGPSDEKAKLA